MTQPGQTERRTPRASPNAVEAIYQTGHWLYSQERIAHACSVFRAMIFIAPEDERGWLALGACHEAQDQRDIALELYEAAGAAAITAPRCELARARILRERGQWGEADAALASAEAMADDASDDDVLALIQSERRRS